MKRDTLMAALYGCVALVVGVLLVRGPRSELEQADPGPTTDPGHPKLVSTAGPPWVRMGSSAAVIGPEGLEAGSIGEGSVPTMSEGGGRHAAGASSVSSGVGFGGAVANRADDPNGPFEGNLPTRATPLLRANIPEVREVADILQEAGLPDHLFEASLREVYGHVQRLALFRERAALSGERFAERTRAVASGSTGGLTADPERTILEFWNGQVTEYAVYARRSLRSRLALGEDGASAVVDRLDDIARRMAKRSLDQSLPSPVTQGPGQ